MIKDTGDRTQFESGAVRDMHAGKGRCDLIPLRQIATFLSYQIIEDPKMTFDECVTCIIKCINEYTVSLNTDWLYNALVHFCRIKKWSRYTCVLEVSKHYEEGAVKYAENNWTKGIPLSSYIDSSIRHLLKHCACMEDEPHDRAFVWNILNAIWTHDNLLVPENKCPVPTPDSVVKFNTVHKGEIDVEPKDTQLKVDAKVLNGEIFYPGYNVPVTKS